MTLRSVVKNASSAMRIIRDDVDDYARRFISPPCLDLTGDERRCVADLRRDGFAVMHGYWSREKAFQVRDRLETFLVEEGDRDFDNGAYLRFWDKRAYDTGVRRLYHVERVVPELGDFRNDSSILRVFARYCGRPYYSGVLVFQHNTRSNANTRYYHVDWFAKQFKAFVYLDDVDEGNGPFTYLRGTHRSWFLRLKKQLLGNAGGSPTSFSERDLKSVLAREVRVCGPAGTLILADVRGFHRGSPQIERSRSILVNYIDQKSPEDRYLDR